MKDTCKIEVDQDSCVCAYQEVRARRMWFVDFLILIILWIVIQMQKIHIAILLYNFTFKHKYILCNVVTGMFSLPVIDNITRNCNFNTFNEKHIV